MNNERPPLLAAYRDNKLSAEVAEELVRLSEDNSIPTHAGEDLPRADKAGLLRKARVAQNGQGS